LSDPSLADRVVRSCPAKLNLRLAVTGRRADGYHDLVSLVAAVELADTLTVARLDGAEADRLTIDGPVELESTEDNLILKAVRAYREGTGTTDHYDIHLTKNIPHGAGLGGGSSDAAGTLQALQQLSPKPLEKSALERLALSLGADVPLFLGKFPAIMRGVGEVLEEVPEWGESLRSCRVAIFRPGFGISTPWAYRSLAADPAHYTAAEEEEARYAQWRSGGPDWWSLPANSFRTVVDRRYPTIPVLLAELNSLQGVRAEMTGSGSACFALARSSSDLAVIEGVVKEAWGDSVYFVHTAFM
jgi:4-diphosphocytidyl-2-C-methyl-D-erythritol kinase